MADNIQIAGIAIAACVPVFSLIFWLFWMLTERSYAQKHEAVNAEYVDAQIKVAIKAEIAPLSQQINTIYEQHKEHKSLMYDMQKDIRALVEKLLGNGRSNC